jgi:hypothetical protein
MVVSSFKNIHDIFRRREEHKYILGSETPHLSVAGALIYSANQTCLNIAFMVDLLARQNQAYYISSSFSHTNNLEG